jgi:hypothetical protein
MCSKQPRLSHSRRVTHNSTLGRTDRLLLKYGACIFLLTGRGLLPISSPLQGKTDCATRYLLLGANRTLGLCAGCSITATGGRWPLLEWCRLDYSHSTHVISVCLPVLVQKKRRFGPLLTPHLVSHGTIAPLLV